MEEKYSPTIINLSRNKVEEDAVEAGYKDEAEASKNIRSFFHTVKRAFPNDGSFEAQQIDYQELPEDSALTPFKQKFGAFLNDNKDALDDALQNAAIKDEGGVQLARNGPYYPNKSFLRFAGQIFQENKYKPYREPLLECLRAGNMVFELGQYRQYLKILEDETTINDNLLLLIFEFAGHLDPTGLYIQAHKNKQKQKNKKSHCYIITLFCSGLSKQEDASFLKKGKLYHALQQKREKELKKNFEITKDLSGILGIALDGDLNFSGLVAIWPEDTGYTAVLKTFFKQQWWWWGKKAITGVPLCIDELTSQDEDSDQEDAGRAMCNNPISEKTGYFPTIKTYQWAVFGGLLVIGTIATLSTAGIPLVAGAAGFAASVGGLVLTLLAISIAFALVGYGIHDCLHQQLPSFKRNAGILSLSIAALSLIGLVIFIAVGLATAPAAGIGAAITTAFAANLFTVGSLTVSVGLFSVVILAAVAVIGLLAICARGSVDDAADTISDRLRDANNQNLTNEVSANELNEENRQHNPLVNTSALNTTDTVPRNNENNGAVAHRD